MSDTQWRRVDEIEGYKQKTFNLSRTDRIGRLITKSFDLMQTIIRDGPNAETLFYDVESLKTEQVNTMNCDPNRSDLFRSILYDLTYSLGSMIESIQERNETGNSHQNYFQGTFTDNTAEFTGDSSTYQSFMSETIKEEPVEFQEDRLFTKNDEKPGGSIDTERPNSEKIIIVENTVMDKDKDTPEINQSSRKRPRMVIVPKENYEAEDEGEDSDEDSVIPSTPNAGNTTCAQCDRSFNDLPSLKRHMIMHEGFQCSDCGIRMKSKEVLRRHYAEYHPGKSAKGADKSGQKRPNGSFKCSECEYTAPNNAALVIHLRTHSGEKPFPCTKCPWKFTDAGSLYRHLRGSHNEKPFKCEKCGMKFGRRAEKWEHKKTKHRH